MREREHETTTGGVKYLGSSLAKPPSINHRVINVLYKVRLTRWAPLITAIMLIKKKDQWIAIIWFTNQTPNKLKIKQ